MHKMNVFIKSDYNWEDMYEHYKANTDSSLLMEKTKYKELLIRYGQEFMGDIIQNVGEVKFHCNLGSFHVLAQNRNNFVDWQKSKELRKQVLGTNDHSDQRVFRFTWQKNLGSCKHLNVYKFRPAKQYRKQLVKVLKENKGSNFYDSASYTKKYGAPSAFLE